MRHTWLIFFQRRRRSAIVIRNPEMMLPGDVSAEVPAVAAGVGASAGGVLGPSYLTTTFPQHVTPNESQTTTTTAGAPGAAVLGTLQPTTNTITPAITPPAIPPIPLTMPHPQQGTNEYIQNAHAIQAAKEEMSQLLQQQTSEKEQLEQAQEQFQTAKERLDRVKSSQSALEGKLQSRVEALTNVLLQDHGHAWNSMYWKLKAYHDQRKREQLPEERGTRTVRGKSLLYIDPSRKEDPILRMLDTWMSKQSAKRKIEGTGEGLERYQIYALDELGFEWEPRKSQWNERFKELKAYMKQYGRQPTKGQRCKGKKQQKDALGIWCSGQVIEYNRKFLEGGEKEGKTSYMTDDKIALLNSIGFVWDKKSHSWEKNFQSLKEFCIERGNCKVPKTYHDQTLYNWVIKQRKYYRKFEKGEECPQTKEQFDLLKDIGFLKDLPSI